MDSHSWILVLSIVLLLGLSAFFSASETAISTFNKIRMKKKADEGDARAGRVMRIWDRYDQTISSILIGNNIVNITASTIGTLVATSLWGPATGAVVATASMTLLVLVFGEIIPKNFGKDNADSLAPKLVGPLSAVIAFLRPLSYLFTGLARLLRGGGDGEAIPSITEEELIYMMDAIEEEGVLEEQERDLVQSALEFDEISIREILTPRVNIVAIDIDAPLEETRQIVVEEGYSRIPVYEKSIDSIIGVLYSRDFLCALLRGEEINLRDMLGEPLFVHKGMKLSQLLASLKARKVNLAVVVDEYGGTLGIVTMEDVLEELVGEIWDEDDEIPLGFSPVADDKWEAAGDFDLWNMLERLEIDEDEVDCDYSTVSGWALHELGHIPEIGEEFTAFGYRFTVLEMDGHRLKKLGIQKFPPGQALEATTLNEKEAK